jgi:hypothetical protein
MPTGPVSVYGLFAFVHVVSEAIIMLLTLVEALAKAKNEVLTNPNPPANTSIKKRLESCFFFKVSTHT